MCTNSLFPYRFIPVVFSEKYVADPAAAEQKSQNNGNGKDGFVKQQFIQIDPIPQLVQAQEC